MSRVIPWKHDSLEAGKEQLGSQARVWSALPNDIFPMCWPGLRSTSAGHSRDTARSLDQPAVAGLLSVQLRGVCGGGEGLRWSPCM